MKKIIFILILLLNYSFLLPQTYCASDTYYARIMYDDVYLYADASNADTLTNILFILPRTYFVRVVSAVDDFYYVEYSTIYGYVDKASIEFVADTPSAPYITTRSFRVYGEQSQDLRTTPTNVGGADTLLVTVPLYSYNLTYYASTVGQEVISGRTNIWYYCYYSVTDQFGYVYSDMTDDFTALTLNIESATYIDTPTYFTLTVAEIENTENTNMLIAILSIPAAIFVILLMQSEKILTTSNSKQSQKTSTREVTEFRY